MLGQLIEAWRATAEGLKIVALLITFLLKNHLWSHVDEVYIRLKQPECTSR
jgi:hypothetical protein